MNAWHVVSSAERLEKDIRVMCVEIDRLCVIESQYLQLVRLLSGTQAQVKAAQKIAIALVADMKDMKEMIA